MLKHSIDFSEEADQIVNHIQATIDYDSLGDAFIPSCVRLSIMSKLHDKWLDGYNQGFLDSTRSKQNV